jgi:hypothetical protein
LNNSYFSLRKLENRAFRGDGRRRRVRSGCNNSDCARNFFSRDWLYNGFDVKGGPFTTYFDGNLKSMISVRRLNAIAKAKTRARAR